MQDVSVGTSAKLWFDESEGWRRLRRERRTLKRFVFLFRHANKYYHFNSMNGYHYATISYVKSIIDYQD